MDQKISNHDYLVFTFTAFYFIGYFGLFSKLSEYVPRLLIYIILLLICGAIFQKYLISGINGYKKEHFNDALSIIVVMFIIFSLLSLLIKRSASTQLLPNSSKKDTALLIFTALFFSPITEELVNRCAIRTALEIITKNDMAINIFSAVLFTFLHLYKMETDLIGALFYSLIYFSLGYVCMYQYRKTENIITPISIHFLWNAFILIGTVLRSIV